MQKRAQARVIVGDIEVVRTVTAEPMSGKTLFGRYQLCETTIKRGNSTVTKAYDTTSSQYVAVKEVNLREVGDWGLFNSMTRKEAAALGNLDHPNIVKLVEFRASDTENKAWIITPWVDGQDLGQFLEQGGRLTKSQINSIMHQVLDALDYMHSIHPPIIHRDIKPENIMLDKEGVVTVVDFGFALSQTSSGTTVFGVTSPGYSAPEVAIGRANAIGPASDLYSAVAVYYRLIAGHDGNGLDKLGSCGLTRRQRKLISKGLDDKPEKRYQSATEVRKALEKAEGKRTESTDMTEQVVAGEGLSKWQIFVATFWPVGLMSQRLARLIVSSEGRDFLPRDRRERLAAKAGVDLATLPSGFASKLQLGNGRVGFLEIVAEAEDTPESRKKALVEKLDRIRRENLIPGDTESHLLQRMIAKKLGLGVATSKEIADCIALEVITDDEAQTMLLVQLGVPADMRNGDSDCIEYVNETFDIVSTRKLGPKAQEKAVQLILPYLEEVSGSRTNRFTLLNSGGISVEKLQDELAAGITDSDQAAHLLLSSKVTSLEARKILVAKCDDQKTLRRIFSNEENKELIQKIAGKLNADSYTEIYNFYRDRTGFGEVRIFDRMATYALDQLTRNINSDRERGVGVVVKCLNAVEYEFAPRAQVYLVGVLERHNTIEALLMISDLGTVTAPEAVKKIVRIHQQLRHEQIVEGKRVLFAIERLYDLDNDMYGTRDRDRYDQQIRDLREMVNAEIKKLKEVSSPNRLGRAKSYIALMTGKSSRTHNFMGYEMRELESIR